jgi:hypothetical protein
MYFTIKALFADEGYLLRAICLLNHPSNSFREELVCCAYSISQYGGRDPPQRRRFRGAYCVLKNLTEDSARLAFMVQSSSKT